MPFSPIGFSEHVIYSAPGIRNELMRASKLYLREILAEDIASLGSKISEAEIIEIFRKADAMRSSFVVEEGDEAEDLPIEERWRYHGRSTKMELTGDFAFEMAGVIPDFTTGGEMLAIILEWIRLTPEMDPPFDMADSPF